MMLLSSCLLVALIVSMITTLHVVKAFIFPSLSIRSVKQLRTSVSYRSFVSCTPSSTIDNSGDRTPEVPLSKAKIEGLELLEIRVGKIVSIGVHAEADSLYVEQVDLGESSGPRTIISGLVQYCTVDQLLNREVVVLCNLKPRAIKGITSNGDHYIQTNHVNVSNLDYCY